MNATGSPMRNADTISPPSLISPVRVTANRRTSGIGVVTRAATSGSIRSRTSASRMSAANALLALEDDMSMVSGVYASIVPVRR